MEKFTYPIYKISIGSKRIVKFIALTKGAIVHSNTPLDVLGKYDNDWRPHISTSTWKDLTPLEVATIKQKEKELKL